MVPVLGAMAPRAHRRHCSSSRYGVTLRRRSPALQAEQHEGIVLGARSPARREVDPVAEPARVVRPAFVLGLEEHGQLASQRPVALNRGPRTVMSPSP
ncbi:MAG: hypothetical protein QOD89_3048 [Bradyrhizobium sp.]|nr:hypothetical protein [Bradyrhizobium sp.]